MISRNSKVCILRKESQWFNQVETFITVYQSGICYSAVVRFTNLNYVSTNTNNLSLDKLFEIKKEKKVRVFYTQ